MIPRWHWIEEFLVGLIITILPIAVFDLVDMPLNAVVYTVALMLQAVAWSAVDLVKLHRFVKRSRAFAARVRVLSEQGRHLEAVQALREWGEFLERNRQ